MTTQVIPQTPNMAIYILFLSVVIMGVKLGLETLARTAELFFPWIILLFLLLIVCIAPQMKLVNIQPILDDGFKPILRAAIPFISFPFLEPVLFLMLSPYVNRTKQTGKALFAGISIGGLFLFIITILTLLVIGVEQSIRQNFPGYMLARQINVGHFLERIEITIAIIWFFTIFIRMSILLYVLALGIAQVLNLQDYRFLTIPLCIIMITFTIVLIPSSTYLLELDRLKIWPYYVATFGLVFPMLLLGIARIRNKRSSD